MREWMAEDLQYFDRKMSEVFAVMEENTMLKECLAYTKNAGGKRIRPLICLLSAESVGGSREDATDVAISIELLHNASLIHDDIIDNNYIRRMKPSNPAIYGEEKAIIMGDFLFGISCMMLARCKDARVMEIVSRAVSEIAEGEYLSFNLRYSDEVSESFYLKVISLKTASVFKASAEAGAVLGGGKEEDVLHLRAYGLNLGIAYQIQDDILDIFGDPSTIGKPVGLDIKNGERTILMIHALENAGKEDRDFLMQILSGELPVTEDHIKRIREIMLSTDSLRYATELAESFVETAKMHVSMMKNTHSQKMEARKKLMFIADWSMKRMREQMIV